MVVVYDFSIKRFTPTFISFSDIPHIQNIYIETEQTMEETKKIQIVRVHLFTSDTSDILMEDAIVLSDQKENAAYYSQVNQWLSFIETSL